MNHEIYNSINKKLKSQIISPRILLDKLRLIDEDSRKSSQYQDHNYLPFYYYLSRFIFPKNIVHIGLDLALPSCCFLQGSKSADFIFGFQKASNIFYSPRLAFSNIKLVKGKKFKLDYHYGNVNDVEFLQKIQKGFDLCMITEVFSNDQINEFLEIAWEYLNVDGFIVLDHITSNKNLGDIFKNFSKSKNKVFFEFETRYGVGIVQK